jgi:ATP-dependent helicase/nuclease subunit A
LREAFPLWGIWGFDKGEQKMWTPQQLKAITLSGCNLLVAAGAGAGKTSVLVERIIQKITDPKHPVDIDKLLVMTFTRAAATEMKERIYAAISKCLDQDPTSTNLQKQLIRMNRASITTIHSFCMEIIKNHFKEAGIDPNFRVGDETETLLLKLETMDELLEPLYEDAIHEETFQSSPFFHLLESFSQNKNDTGLRDMIDSVYSFMQSHPWPMKWLQEQVEKLELGEGTDFLHTAWGKVFTNALFLEFCSFRERYRHALDCIEGDAGLFAYQTRFQEELQSIQNVLEWMESKTDMKWDDLRECLMAFSFLKLSRKGKDADAKTATELKDMRVQVRDRVEKFWKKHFSLSSHEVHAQLKKMEPLYQELCTLVGQFSKRYQEKKREKSILDFNDLEHLAVKILVDEATGLPTLVAKRYQDRFVEILVDEYQDSNLVQEILIRSISREERKEPNVFMVGDVKQSIYRFRQARPDLFLQKYNTYSPKDEGVYRKINLFQNFRSRKEVIDGVNFLFMQIMSEDLGELHYDQNEALIHASSYEEIQDVDFSCEVSLLSLDDLSFEGEDEGSLSDVPKAEDAEASFGGEESNEEPNEEIATFEIHAMSAEAQLVANQIKRYMEDPHFKIWDNKAQSHRRPDFSDVVVLLRATSQWAEVFVEEFSHYGIPVFADNDTSFFKNMEVNVIISLLEVLDNPLSDIPLLSVLRSPLYGFSTEELADLRMEVADGYMLDCLKALAKQGQPKAIKVCADLERWRNKAQYFSTDELLWYLYEDTLFYSFVGAMPFGKQRQANLRILFERAKQYEKTSYKGLFHFIHFLNQLKTKKGDMSSAKILGENENLVRILSIHKSKGLEFPIVILAGCGKMFNTMDEKKRMILHQDLGLGSDIVDVDKRLIFSSLPKEAMKLAIKRENVSEELRLLYVAMTRARGEIGFDRGRSKYKNLLREMGHLGQYPRG